MSGLLMFVLALPTMRRTVGWRFNAVLGRQALDKCNELDGKSVVTMQHFRVNLEE